MVRDLRTGGEQRVGVGALPPPPLPDPDANPDAPPPVRNVRISSVLEYEEKERFLKGVHKPD